MVEGRPYHYPRKPLRVPWVPKSWVPQPDTRTYRYKPGWEWLQPERNEKTLLLEPPVGHHEESLDSAVLAPRILHLVT